MLLEGCERYTWQDVESNDFIERATNFVCNDVFKNVSIVQNNFKEICVIAESWVNGNLDVFGTVSDDATMYIDDLHSRER